MQLKIAASTAELTKLRSDWNRLAGRHAMDSWEWHATWWDQYASLGDLAVMCLYDAGRLRALFPTWIERTALWGNTLRFLGSGAVSTDYAKILAEPAVCEAACDQFASILRRPRQHMLPHIDALELEGVVPHGNAATLLTPMLSAARFVVDAQPLTSCWRSSLSDSWDGYLARLNSTMRRKLRKALRRLDSKECDFQWAATPHEIELAWPTLVDLHQRRFISKGEPGCFADSRFSAFLHTAIERLAVRNMTAIATCTMMGRPIAAQLYFLNEDGLQMYQSGVDPTCMEAEPGYTLFAGVLRQAIAAGHESLDFLRGDEPYKSKLGALPIPLQKIRLAAPLWSSRARFGIYQAARRFKRTIVARQKLVVAENGAAPARCLVDRRS